MGQLTRWTLVRKRSTEKLKKIIRCTTLYDERDRKRVNILHCTLCYSDKSSSAVDDDDPGPERRARQAVTEKMRKRETGGLDTCE